MKFKSVCESVERNQNIRDAYKRLASVDSIDMDNLDNDAVRKIAGRNFLEKEQVIEALKESVITEDQTIGDAAEQLANKMDAEVIDENDDVKAELDRALATNKRLQRRGKTDGWSNICLTGEAGVGKTARVKQWAKERGVNLYIKRATDLDVTDMGGAPVPDENRKKVSRLTTSEWDQLDRPNSVLFLDELNRAASDVRGSLLTLVNNHTIPDQDVPGGERFLKNMLFTVVAINPADSRHNVDELDSAEYDRMKEVPVIANKKSLLKYLTTEFKRDIEASTDEEDKLVLAGQLKLVETLLSSPDFYFDSVEQRMDNIDRGQHKSLSPRTFEAAINNCDGTKDDLLAVWSSNCGSSSKSMVERILKNYVDVDDEANAALKQHASESNVFKGKGSMSSILKKSLGLDS